MTGSSLSLYLEETKTNDDSTFQSQISPIKREGIHDEPKNRSNLSISSGGGNKSSRGKGHLSEMLSSTALELHKVALIEREKT